MSTVLPPVSWRRRSASRNGCSKPSSRAGEMLRLAEVNLGSEQCLADFGAAGDRVDDQKLAKALQRCQSGVTKSGKVLAIAQLKALTTCGAEIFECAQTKPDDAACLTKADKLCEKQLAKFESEERELDSALDKACGSIEFSTLRAIDAMALSVLANRCAEVDVTSLLTLNDYRQCLIRTHACETEALAARAMPRIAELFTARGRTFGSEFCIP